MLVSGKTLSNATFKIELNETDTVNNFSILLLLKQPCWYYWIVDKRS
jgi:hypothetical protein